MSSGLTLVILAAGMGSRYGGLKQLERVGPGGETLMDYSVFDAAREGFTRVVFIVRPDIEDAFRDFATARFGRAIEVVTVLQRLEDVPSGCEIPAGRAKPWGTTHALLAAEQVVREPFAVVNADDFYGRRAFAAVSRALTASPVNAAEFSLVGYRVRDTISRAGTVNRAVCELAPDGWLVRLDETFDIALVSSGGDTFIGRTRDGAPRAFGGDTLVSMNMWGFTPCVFDLLREDLARFFAATPDAKAECYLPETIGVAVASGAAAVRVLDARSEWLGITYPADRAAVESALRVMVEGGDYPARLWEAVGAEAP